MALLFLLGSIFNSPPLSSQGSKAYVSTNLFKELKAFTKADAAVASDLARRKDMALHKDKAWYGFWTCTPPRDECPQASTHTGNPTKKTHVCWRQEFVGTVLEDVFLFDLQFVDLFYITYCEGVVETFSFAMLQN